MIEMANCDEIVKNEKGGKQSKLEARFTLIDSRAMFKLAHVLYKGEQRYGRDNWRQISAESHIDHAMSHLFAYTSGDRGSDHLAHAFTRIMMAIGVEEEEI